MKFEQDTNNFKPITITLETEKEAAAVATALGATINSVNSKVLGEIYNRLDDAVEWRAHFTYDDTVRIKEV